MNVSVNGAYIYYTIPILGGIPITQTTVSLFLVTVLLCTAAIVLGRNLKTRPDGKQVLVEKGVGMLVNLVSESMGPHNVHWTPYIGTIFLSSICGSLIGLTGFFRSSTASLCVPLTWALMTSVIIWTNNIRQSGFLGWLKGFTEPTVIMTPMNLVSEIAQPASLALRHFGNVAGGGVITSILYTALSIASSVLLGLMRKTVVIPILVVALGGFFLYRRIVTRKKRYLIGAIAFFLIGICGILECTGLLRGIPILQYGVPAVLSLYFDLFSGFIQAFVFSLLSMVYIATSCPPPPEENNQTV